MGGDGGSKGHGIIYIKRQTILDSFIAQDWMKEHFEDAELLDVQYDFTRGMFGFVIKSAQLIPVPNGHLIPLILAKPSIDRPPTYIIKELVVKELREFRNRMVGVGDWDANHIHYLDDFISAYDAEHG